MARGTGTVTVRFLGDTDHLEKAFDKVNGGLSKVGGAFASLGKAAALGIGAAAAAAIPFAVNAVKMASDVEESLSKVNTVFGKSGKEIDKWAKGAATSIGLSRGEALDAAGSFGNMFTQLGIGAPKAAEMSKSIVGLAADFASFHNADISEVIAAQSAAFRGEYDSLQKFLPLINAATVEQKAMEMTGKANAKALTAQEKALAVNALMAEGAGKALGDFKRTSGGLANQMRILKARASDFSAQVGAALLPLVMKGLDAFGKLSSQLKEDLTPVVEHVVDIIKSWAPIWDELVGGIRAFAAAFRAADGDVTSAGFPGIMERIAGFVRLTMIPALMKWAEIQRTVYATIAQYLGKVASVVVDVVDNIISFLQEYEKEFSDIWAQIQDVVKSAFEAIETYVRIYLEGVRLAVENGLRVVKALWSVFGDDITSFLRGTFEAILEVVRGALEVLKGIFDLIKSVLTGKWGDAWDALKAIVDGAFDVMFGLMRNAATNVIPSIFSVLGTAITTAATLAFEGMKNAFKAALNWMIDQANGFLGKVAGPLGFANNLPGVGRLVPDVPHIEHLATGGVFRGAALVGEKGPELLVGSRMGRIVPNNQLLGGVNVTVNGAMDPVAVAIQIEEILTRFRRQGGGLRFT